MTLCASAFVVPTVASCIDLVVHCVRERSGQRRVAEIVALGRRVENGVIETSTLFKRTDGELRATASNMPAEEKFAAAGYTVASLLSPS